MKHALIIILLFFYKSVICDNVTDDVYGKFEVNNSTVEIFSTTDSPSPIIVSTVTTVTTISTSPVTKSSTTTTKPTTTPSTSLPSTSSTTPVPSSTKPTPTSPATPSTSHSGPTAQPAPTAAPHKDRHFDGPSFIGGIVLASGLMAIGFVAFKFYKARTERNYHTL